MKVERLPDYTFEKWHCQCYLRSCIEAAGFNTCLCAPLNVTKAYDPTMYQAIESILIGIPQLGSEERLKILCDKITDIEVEAHLTRCYPCALNNYYHINDSHYAEAKDRLLKTKLNWRKDGSFAG